ncbi:MAG: neprosin family prolyl endopeptidase [Actinophytocola sp.]|uniref:neprosin family prolyl endopeptidase n=1 Tax=Actinophytocola sp. TaxID=1872138 RepID=UPI003D6C3159
MKDVSPQPFDDFLRSVLDAEYDDFRRLPDAQVENQAAFEEMRAYVLEQYRDVKVTESYVDEDGQVLDFIPEAQHPAVRRWNGDPAADPPDAPPAPEPSDTALPEEAGSRAIDTSSALPRYRYPPEARRAPDGTIANYRTTLQQLSRFPNLAAYSAKDAVARTSMDSFDHRYATGEQDIECLGGASYLNVWNPFVTPLYKGTFSQQWYLAGHDGTLLQSVECGWQIDYRRYGDSEPHLFVFTTRNNYATGSNFYNEDGGVFHTVPNPHVRPGQRLQFSHSDGTQIEYKMGFYRTGQGWWFYFDDHAIGCIPSEFFNNGPLTSRATRVRFGGEAATKVSTWPPMGSGQFASAGFGKSAYQRGAFVNPLSGGAVYASLSEAGSTSGSCYTIDITNNSSSVWGTYLFFGGPGGQPC